MQEVQMRADSMDVVEYNINQLRQIFPEVFTEDKIDFNKLQNILGNYTDDGEEKYRFSWKGKLNSLRLAQSPSCGTLRPCREESRNWDSTNNIYIEGDNLEVLKLLQNSYLNKIKLIYIDPPYNTGNDFVYKDDFKDNIKNYKRITGQIDGEGNATSTNKESDGRFHTNWLNMMYPRLMLARNLLKENGVIFISISDTELDNLKKICNEIFGETNFAADIIWNSTKSVTNTALISVSHTHTLVYFKDAKYYIKHREEFRLREDGSGFANPDNDPRGPWKADPFQVGGWRPNQQYEIINPKTGVVYRPNPNCSWKNDYEKFQELLADDRIVFGIGGEGGPQRKRFIYEAEERGRVTKTLWDDVETTTNGTQQVKNLFDGNIVFDNPKPVGFIKRIIELAADNDDIILDFFSGSATTAHACMQFNLENNTNCRYILIQLPEVLNPESKEDKTAFDFLCGLKKPPLLSEIGKERIRRAGDRILGANPETTPDIGFRVFKLDSSNIKKWSLDTKNLEQSLLEQIDNFVEGRSEEDALYEIILKNGLPLTIPVTEMNLNGRKVFLAGDCEMIVCLDNDITFETAADIVKLCTESENKGRIAVVFKDNGFADDSVKTNVKETLKSFGIDKFVTV